MELAERIRPLEERTAKLPDPVKERFRDDPDITRLLTELRTWAEQARGDISSQDLLDLEARETELVEVWTKKLQLAEVEVRISGSQVPGQEPRCRYCGAAFQVPQQGTERSAWSRLRKHVEKLHPKEWRAAQGG